MMSEISNTDSSVGECVSGSDLLASLSAITGGKAIKDKTPFVGNDSVVYILMDCSISMEGNNISQAKSGAYEYSKKAIAKNYNFGLISFKSDACCLVEATNDINSIYSAIDSLNVDGGTNMCDAITLGTELIVKHGGKKILCIITDGMPFNPKKTLEAARAAEKQDIEITAIGTDDADKYFIEQLATKVENAITVDSSQLELSISNTVTLLPG